MIDMGEPISWTDNDKSVFSSLLREFRRGQLDTEFPDDTFADDRSVNYWNEEFWRTLCRLYNNRANVENASQREPYEMILRGELLRGEFCIERCNRRLSTTLSDIFSPCVDCQRIPIFPTSLLKKLGYDRAGRSSSNSRSRSRSRSSSRFISESGASGSGAGTGTTIYNNINSGMVDREATSEMVEMKGADEVVKSVCTMVDRGLIAANEMQKILDLVGEWRKEQCVWWTFLVSSTPSLEMKAQALKDRLRA